MRYALTFRINCIQWNSRSILMRIFIEDFVASQRIHAIDIQAAYRYRSHTR